MFKIRPVIIIKDKPITSFVILGVLVLSLIFFIEKINGRFWLNDFKVMYLAADALMNNQQVYGVPFGLGTGFFKYSPFTALLFVPYTALEFDLAATIHFFISGFSAIGTVILLEKIIREFLVPIRRKTILTLTAVFFCVILHLVRELHLGNINMILLFLLSLSLFSTLKSKPALSGLLLALAILAKPYFIVCLFPFLANRRINALIYAGVSLMVFILSSVIIVGFTKGINLYQEWFTAMAEHNVYLFSNHTVFSLIKTYVGVTISASWSTILLIFLSVLSSIYFWKITNKTKDKPNLSINYEGALIVNFFLIIAMVPSILITDTEHFLFSLPLIAILLFHLRKDPVWPLILFILLIVLYEGNSSDLLGKNLSANVEEMGILGFSNLIILGSTFLWFSLNRRKSIVSAKG